VHGIKSIALFQIYREPSKDAGVKHRVHQHVAVGASSTSIAE
jgi:hypothetical protein